MSEVNDSNNANVSPTSVSAGRVSCAPDTATPGGKGDAGGASVVAGAAGGSGAVAANAGNPQPAPKKTLFQAIKYLVVGGSSAATATSRSRARQTRCAAWCCICCCSRSTPRLARWSFRFWRRKAYIRWWRKCAPWHALCCGTSFCIRRLFSNRKGLA